MDWTGKQMFFAVTTIIFAVMTAMMIKATPTEEGLTGIVNVCPWWAYPASLAASAAVGGLVAVCYKLQLLKEHHESRENK